MRMKLYAGMIGVASLMTAMPVVAHHAFSAEFDAKKPVKLKGTVTKMEWINPHTWIHIDVKGANGVEKWMIEGGAPNALLRRGFNRDSLPTGTEIRIRGFQARDRTNRAAGTQVTLLADGSRLFVGTTGVGTPGDPTVEGGGEQ